MNEAGIKYYSDLIDALLAEGITPCVTIFHWDYPQALEDKYGGFLDMRIVDDFVAYSQILFERLGNRVKHWITINEVRPPTPLSPTFGAEQQLTELFSLIFFRFYKVWLGRRSDGITSEICQSRSRSLSLGSVLPSDTRNRLAKTLLLCNARTVNLYRREYKPKQNGTIGITLVSWFIHLPVSS